MIYWASLTRGHEPPAWRNNDDEDALHISYPLRHPALEPCVQPDRCADTHISLAFDEDLSTLYSSTRKNGYTMFPAGPSREY